jgi:hypothetical protein
VTGAFGSAKTNADQATISVLNDAAQRFLLDGNAGTTVGKITLGELESKGYITSATINQAADKTKSFTISYDSTSLKVTVAKE